nr:hypothetical protein Iba_chr11dCG6840 [Ipomoea batatas]
MEGNPPAVPHRMLGWLADCVDSAVMSGHGCCHDSLGQDKASSIQIPFVFEVIAIASASSATMAAQEKPFSDRATKISYNPNCIQTSSTAALTTTSSAPERALGATARCNDNKRLTDRVSEVAPQVLAKICHIDAKRSLQNRKLMSSIVIPNFPIDDNKVKMLPKCSKASYML